MQSLRLPLLFLLAFLAACTTTATEVLVVFECDLPASDILEVRAYVSEGGAAFGDNCDPAPFSCRVDCCYGTGGAEFMAQGDNSCRCPSEC